MMKIWGRPNSICTLRVLWACAESGIDWELELASGTMGPDGHISGGATPFGHVNTPAYRAMNPNGTVPTINDQGVILWDSIAILSYIAGKYGAASLHANSPEVFARALQWMCWTNEYLEPLLHTLVMELVRLAPEKRNPTELESARKTTIEQLNVLDRHLSASPYLADDRFSMGDIPAGATVYRWLLFDLERPAMPHLEDWQRRLQKRPAFQQLIAPSENHL